METPRPRSSRWDKVWMLLVIVLIPLFLVGFWVGVFLAVRGLFT